VHIPVMVSEIVQTLAPRCGGVYLDGTLGAGGYAEAILEASDQDGRVIGLDRDRLAVEKASARLAAYGNRFAAVHGGYHHAGSILPSLGVTALDGAVLDLGLSSDQVDDPERGFSFRLDGPLDMRFDTSSGDTVLMFLHNLSARSLEEILATYGEERYCKKLSRGILEARDRGKLKTTVDLAELVTRLQGRRRGKIHPATRVFQALRIAVNHELENLDTALREIPLLLTPGGRLCVVSYHSLEDRAVKLAFRELAKDKGRWSIVTPKPVRPSVTETRINPRARSARMRAIEACSPELPSLTGCPDKIRFSERRKNRTDS
jgi:16S rRNA (cytosine1402-N4)-methyltransferase